VDVFGLVGVGSGGVFVELAEEREDWVAYDFCVVGEAVVALGMRWVA
jgi:hypothetical protein